MELTMLLKLLKRGLPKFISNRAKTGNTAPVMEPLPEIKVIEKPVKIRPPAPPKPLKKLDLKSKDGFLVALEHYSEDMSVRAKIGRFVGMHNESGGLEVSDAIKEKLCTLALPEMVRIETVSACNLRCQHCTTGVAYDSTDRRIMKMETFNILVEQLKQIPTIRTATLYLGGEPLLNKNHALMCKRIKEETTIQKTKFVTNGMLLTQAWCDKIADANVDSISISLDGLSPEEHNSIRVRSDYETIKKNIYMLKNTLESKGCATKLQIGNTQINTVKGASCMASKRAAVVPDFLLKDFPGYDIGSGFAMIWPGMTAEQTGIKGLTVQHTKPWSTCDHPFYDLAVRPNGDIILCCYDISGKQVMGNIHQDNILDIYQAPGYVELRRKMLDRDREAVPDICKRCWNFTGATFVRVE